MRYEHEAIRLPKTENNIGHNKKSELSHLLPAGMRFILLGSYWLSLFTLNALKCTCSKLRKLHNM